LPVQKAKFKTLDTTALGDIQKELYLCKDFIKVRYDLYATACRKCTPLVQQLMVESLHKSGLKKRSGELEKWVGRSIFYPSKKGTLKIGPPKGLTAHDYARMGALQYGSIKHLDVKNKRTRRTIKVGALKSGSSPSGTVVLKEHPFFKLDSGQIQRLETAFCQAFQESVNAFWKGKQ